MATLLKIDSNRVGYPVIEGNELASFSRERQSNRAWITGHRGRQIPMPANPINMYLALPHFWSIPTINWERHVRNDPQGRLPRCLEGRPPIIRTPYVTLSSKAVALETHAELVNCYDRLHDIEQTSDLWNALQLLCRHDDLEYQFRASSLVRTALSAVAGQEEQWNGPGARSAFNSVEKAIARLRRAIEMAARRSPLAPSDSWLDEHVVHGTNHRIDQELHDKPDLTVSNGAGDSNDVIDDVETLRQQAPNDRLYPDELRMRDIWREYWGTVGMASLVFVLLDSRATALRDAWGSVEDFNVMQDQGRRKQSYLTSRICRSLIWRFPNHPAVELVNVCDELVHLAYGESARDAAFKLVERLRRR